MAVVDPEASISERVRERQRNSKRRARAWLMGKKGPFEWYCGLLGLPANAIRAKVNDRDPVRQVQKAPDEGRVREGRDTLPEVPHLGLG